MKLTATGFDDKRIYPIPVPLKADRSRWCASISTIMQSMGIMRLRIQYPALSGVNASQSVQFRSYVGELPSDILCHQQTVAESLGRLMAIIGIAELHLEPNEEESKQLEAFWSMRLTQKVAPIRHDTDPGTIVVLCEEALSGAQDDGRKQDERTESGSPGTDPSRSVE